MATFEAVVDVEAPVGEVWEALTDWPGHGRWIPLTRSTVTSERPDGVGASFVARTGIGPLAFDDPMTVTGWQPPSGGGAGRATLVKTGNLILGSASIEVAPRAGGGSRVTWREDVEVRPVALTHRAAPLVGLVGRLGFRGALRRFARQVEYGHGSGPR